MKILIIGINFSPELVGIGPYTSEMAEWLVCIGHSVEVITAKPYYPGWKRFEKYTTPLFISSIVKNLRVLRCPIYVPRKPTGIRRVIHHLSFLCAATIPVIVASLRRRPDLVMTIAPSLATVPLARLAATIGRAKSWLHIQDFEIAAAIATGLLRKGSMAARFAAGFEKMALAGFDRYSSISPQMCKLLQTKDIPATKVREFRNWSDINAIAPLDRASAFRKQWNIVTPHVALYSGNIANKQGVSIIVEAARHLRHRSDLTFVVCGDGPTLDALTESAQGMDNIKFFPLQPRENLGELLGLATVHLLPQLEDAADLVLPSKLTNMLASGRPVVATAGFGTGLAEEVSGCGAISPPGDSRSFAAAIIALIDDPAVYDAVARNARRQAERRWSKEAILNSFADELETLVGRNSPREDDGRSGDK